MGEPNITFHKYEGLGNDFVVVELKDESDLPAARAAGICDRRHGVGADGVLLVLPARAEGCDARMRVINADGSISETCGNGVRCVALHLARAGGTPAGATETVRIDTDAGNCACVVEDANGEGIVTADMGFVRVLGERSVDVGGEQVRLKLADAGNPHAVIFGAFDRAVVERLGPRLATHPDFPRGTNVEFAVVDGEGLDLVVWERGVGITLACGTGACAAAAVACADGVMPRGVPIAVRLPGGRLDVTIHEDDRVTMRGPARHVFSGVLG